MPDSAPSSRETRRAETTRELIRLTRRLTAERGLAGFTIEEVCSEAAVSRRTFFNYFASKEDAVLGVPLERSDAGAVAHFLAQGDAAVELTPTLLNDLADLAVARWRALDIAPDTIADLFRAVDKEPRLLARMIELAFEEEAYDTRLIEQREGLLPGDLRAQVAAQLIGAVLRSSAAAFLSSGTDAAFVDIFLSRLDAARALFASQSNLIGFPQ